MSTIVGIQGDGWCVMGADSRVIEDDRVYVTPKKAGKIISRPGYVIAIAGNWRPAQILAHQLQYPKPPTFTTIEALDGFVTSEFIPAMKDAYLDNGFTNEGEDATDAMLAINGTIYEIGSDWSWLRDVNNLYAIGSGSAYALGSLVSLTTLTGLTDIDDATTKAKLALEAACKFDPNTAKPLIIHQQVRK